MEKDKKKKVKGARICNFAVSLFSVRSWEMKGAMRRWETPPSYSQRDTPSAKEVVRQPAHDGRMKARERWCRSIS